MESVAVPPTLASKPSTHHILNSWNDGSLEALEGVLRQAERTLVDQVQQADAYIPLELAKLESLLSEAQTLIDDPAAAPASADAEHHAGAQALAPKAMHSLAVVMDERAREGGGGLADVTSPGASSASSDSFVAMGPISPLLVPGGTLEDELLRERERIATQQAASAKLAEAAAGMAAAEAAVAAAVEATAQAVQASANAGPRAPPEATPAAAAAAAAAETTSNGSPKVVELLMSWRDGYMGVAIRATGGAADEEEEMEEGAPAPAAAGLRDSVNVIAMAKIVPVLVGEGDSGSSSGASGGGAAAAVEARVDLSHVRVVEVNKRRASMTVVPLPEAAGAADGSNEAAEEADEADEAEAEEDALDSFVAAHAEAHSLKRAKTAPPRRGFPGAPPAESVVGRSQALPTTLVESRPPPGPWWVGLACCGKRVKGGAAPASSVPFGGVGGVFGTPLLSGLLERYKLLQVQPSSS